MLLPVDLTVWRGSRPGAPDFAGIKAFFKSVVSLEGLAEDQKEMAELTPVPVISIPISFKEIYFTGLRPKGLIDTILREIAAAPKPCLVHCEHGQDRTGLIIACYRVKVYNWTRADAWAEAKKLGYRGWPLNAGLNKTWEIFGGMDD